MPCLLPGTLLKTFSLVILLNIHPCPPSSLLWSLFFTSTYVYSPLLSFVFNSTHSLVSRFIHPLVISLYFFNHYLLFPSMQAPSLVISSSFIHAHSISQGLASFTTSHVLTLWAYSFMPTWLTLWSSSSIFLNTSTTLWSFLSTSTNAKPADLCDRLYV